MKTTLSLCISGALLALTLPAHATNGYFTHGLGAINKAMAGAGTADPQEAMAIANNPVAAALLPESLQVGLAAFSPRRSFTASASQANGNGGAFTLGAGTMASDSEFFPIPYLAKTWRFSQSQGVGIAAYGRGGMNTDYRSGTAVFDPDGPGPAGVMTLPGVFGGGNAGVDLSQLFVEGAFAQRIGERFSWGVSGVFAAQAFEVTGVAPFAPFTRSFAASGGATLPTDLTNNGHDFAFGAGFKAGVSWVANSTLTLALSYQSKISMSEFSDYASLFAEAGDFDIPSSVRFGSTWRLTPRLTLHYDVEHTQFNEIDAVGNPVANIFACPTAGAGGSDLESCLGGSRGAGFGWEDMTTHKFGLAVNPVSLPNWTLHGGLSVGDQPIPGSEVLFNVLAPGVIERHYTLGATHTLASGRRYTVAFMMAPEATVSGASAFDPTQRLELRMHQYELEFSYSW